MNWIEYSKRKPEPKPKRQLWVKIREKDNHVYYSVAWSTASFDVDYITDWAEIEPPQPPLSPVAVAFNKALDEQYKPQTPSENDIRIMKASEERIKKGLAEISPPTPERILAYEKQFNATQQAAWKAASTPDPFEEWFRTVGVFIFDNPNGKYALARAAYDKGWDAAIRWKEGK